MQLNRYVIYRSTMYNIVIQCTNIMLIGVPIEKLYTLHNHEVMAKNRLKNDSCSVMRMQH